MPKRSLDVDVLTAARQRTAWTFDTFERVYLSFSAGKDSTVMLHIAADEARKRGKRFGVLLIDLEAQYKLTMQHAQKCVEMYADCIDLYWVCLPIHLRNAVSVYQSFWICWDEERRDIWVRDMPPWAISDEQRLPFFRKGMEFEEFVPEFGAWYAQGKSCACLVGIRADESLNRFRTISSRTKVRYDDRQYTTLVRDQLYNVYPVYDWKTEDIWIYHAKFPDKPHNRLYDLMHKAGLTLHQMRICQPYGDDQRKGLWLFHIIEPETWARVIARVNGANGGALYMQEWGNINGYRRITKPVGHTWQSFARLIIASLPPKTSEHYENKVTMFIHWWQKRGYEDGIPDEAAYHMEAKRLVPSWRRICKSLLRNDYWCKGLSFTQQRSEAYDKYLELMKRRKAQWGVQLFNSEEGGTGAY